MTPGHAALPCGHTPALYATTDGRQLPIAIPPTPLDYAVADLPAAVWCPLHGWVKVDAAYYNQLGAHA